MINSEILGKTKAEIDPSDIPRKICRHFPTEVRQMVY